MKTIKELLTSPEQESELVMGNTALARAMLESGVQVITSYPGSPTPEIASALKTIPVEERNFYFEFSTNEKVAAEVALGATVNGQLSCVFFKSVGLNVAADSFVQFGLMECLGGLVVLLGDDPGANSSQNEQDNRHYAALAYLPVYEPSTPAEAYRMFKEAARYAQEHRQAVIVRLTTHICHAKERITFAPYQPTPLSIKALFDKKNGPYIPITSAVFPLKKRALEKLERARQESARLVEKKLYPEQKRGLITAGLPHSSLLSVLGEERISILKLGLVYPLPKEEILNFLQAHEEVKILEELDDFLEKEIKSLAYEAQLKCRIIGKVALEDFLGEYTPDKVREVLNRCWPGLVKAEKGGRNWPLAARPAQLCPGCGHRSAFYALKKALPPEAITVADIGCHTLGFLPPYEMGEILLSMGHSPATAAGLALGQKERPVVAFLGDSTLFHAALPAILNAVYNNHHFTLVIMENQTTAMTGHQDLPSNGHNFNGDCSRIPIKTLLAGLGVTQIWECDTYQQAKLAGYLREALASSGFKVVIAKHPCMLKFTKEQKRKGSYLKKQVQVEQSRCTQKYDCLSSFACPSFQVGEKGEVTVNPDLCIGDGSCRQVCSVNAIEEKK